MIMDKGTLIFVSLTALFGQVLSRSPPVLPISGSGPQVAVLKYNNEMNPDGSHQWEFELDNGVKEIEQGSIKELGPELAELTKQGSFSWISPEGEKIDMSYTADVNGYQPQGSHLPVAPPIPEAILRAIEWNEAHPEPEQLHKQIHH